MQVIKMLMGGFALSLSLSAWASTEIWCVFDPVGTQGDISRRLRDVALHSQQQKVPIQLKTYRNEQQVLNAFNQNQCSGAVITNFHSRPYNRFMATSSGIGMLQSNRTARNLLLLLNHPYVSKRLSQDGYDVLGFIPVGNAYMLMRDTQVSGIADLKNQRIGVLSDEPAQVALVKSIGAIPVNMDIANPLPHLQRRELDLLPMPIYSLLPYNLKKELGEQARVVNFPIAYATMTVIVRAKAYPAKYATPMRQWFVQNANSLTMQATRWDNSLPAYLWEDVSSGEQRSYTLAVNKVRNQFIQNGYYDRGFFELSKRLVCMENAKNLTQQRECNR